MRTTGTPGGRCRIRTGVRGFADRCLATRPTDHLSILAYANIEMDRKDTLILILAIFF